MLQHRDPPARNGRRSAGYPFCVRCRNLSLSPDTAATVLSCTQKSANTCHADARIHEDTLMAITYPFCLAPLLVSKYQSVCLAALLKPIAQPPYVEINREITDARQLPLGGSVQPRVGCM